MTEEFFYHYTSETAAKDIVLSGMISPSLAANGDAAHGDGVYLTTLDPRLGKETIKNNNWDGLAGSKDKQVDAYFEIFMPSDKVKRAKEKRDIQVHLGALTLADYKWSLKNWDGNLLATQHFMVSSQGEAARHQPLSMGRYTLAKNIVTCGDSPVYKHVEQDRYLYRSIAGRWCVGSIAGWNKCGLFQSKVVGDYPPSPPKTLPWKYTKEGVFMDDVTLRVYPCY